MITLKYSVRVSLAPKPHKDGTRSVRVRVSWLSQRIDITLPESIHPDQWDDTTSRPRPRYQSADGRTTAASINASINRTIAEIDDRFARARIEGRTPSRSDIAEGLVGGCSKMPASADFRVLSLLREYIADMERSNGWQYNTSKHFVTMSGHIRTFSPSAQVSDISEQWLTDLSAYLISVGLQNGTVNTMLSRFKWFCSWARKHGYPIGDNWDSFRPRLKSPPKPVIYLTIEELAAIRSHDYTADSLPHLDNVRDAFVLQCATGLRYSDLAQLTWDMVGEDAIRLTTRKTAEPLVVELNDISRDIIATYRNASTDPHGYVVRTISNQKYNDYLKDMARLAGIDTPVVVSTMHGSRRTDTTYRKWELITSHVGRKTFVVTMLTAGASPLAVMAWTGHKNYKTMEPYISISDKQRADAVQMFNRLTSVSLHHDGQSEDGGKNRTEK